MPELWRDFLRAVRLLARTPGFCTAAVLGFALGIGASTAIFSVVEAVLWKPLAYRDPDRLVVALHEGVFPVSPADYFDYQRLQRSFTALGAAQAWSANFSGGGAPERVAGIAVTPEVLPLLGVDPLLGAVTGAAGGEPLGAHRLLLSHGFWKRRFGGDPRIIGQTVMADGARWEIAAVMPPSFRFAPFWITNAEVWVPLDLAARRGDRAGRSLRLFGRLKPGVTAEQANADLNAIAGELARRYPGTNARLGIRVLPLALKVTGPVRPLLAVLTGAVALLLLLACANGGGLILARAASRSREIAVRLAIGAGRVDLLRHLAAESLALSLAGGAAGLALARWGVAALLRALPEGALPRAAEIAVDARALAFAFAASLLAGLAAGLAPAWRAGSLSLHGILRAGSRGAPGGMGEARARRWLAAAEVALSVLLLAGAGLLAKSFLRFRALPAGFDPANLLSFEVSTGGTPRDATARRAPFYQEVLERLRRAPGVEAAGATNHAPLAGDVWSRPFQVEGRPLPPAELPSAVYRIATPGYLAAMGIPLLSGRDFTAADRDQAPGVVLVNETLARRCWPQGGAVGRRLAVGSASPPEWRTVVGVVRDLMQRDWTPEASPELFLPLAQQPGGAAEYFTFLVRTRSEPAALASTVRGAVSAVEPNAVVSRLLPMREAIAGHLWRARVAMLLMGVFAAAALVMAAAGVYGTVAHAVARREQEIGIRLALGARQGAVMRMVVLDGMKPVWIGLAAGTVGAAAAARLMETLLFPALPGDPAVLAMAAAVLAPAALAATCMPARRILRADPASALRRG